MAGHDGLITAADDEALRELADIYHARNAEGSVMPPHRAWMLAHNAGESP